MSPRARVFGVVVVAAAASAAAVVAVAVLTGGTTGSASRSSTARPKGAPPLALDFGLRTDPEARALARASNLYAHGRRSEAGAIFARYSSLRARIGAAFATWPRGTLARMQALVRRHPSSGLAQLQLGLALAWSARSAEARLAWRAAAERDPDSPAAVRAGTLLHPDLPAGLPEVVLGFPAPAALSRLPAARQLVVLRLRARRGSFRDKLLYGVVLQRLQHPVSAERQFAAAARLAPHDPEARVAAAVGLFSKDDPSRTFAKLGPLVHVFPHSATVRFHLGLCLIWIRQLAQARTELRLARAEGAGTPFASAANALLRPLSRAGTK